MKKLLLLFASVFLYIGSFASVSGTHLPIAPGDTLYDGVTISTYVQNISFTGNYETYLIAKKVGDSVWLSGNQITSTGIGVKTSSITGLRPGTTYQFSRVFKKAGVFDTLLGTTFRTLNVANFPTFTVQKIPKIGFSMLILTVSGDVHLYSEWRAWYGQTYEQSNLIFGTGNWSDTIFLFTPTANTTYNYFFTFHVDSITGLRDSLLNNNYSITTPVITDGNVSNQSVTGVTKDSATINAFVQLGTYTGTIQFHVKDPASSTYLQSSPVIPTNTNGSYSYTFSGLSDGKDYSYVIVFRDTLDADTLVGHFTTLSIPKIAAPAVTFFGGTWADCGKVYVSLKISPVSGDTCRFVILRRIINTTVWDTIYSRNLLTAMLTLSDLELAAPYGGTRFEFKIVGYSKDRLMSESSIINVLTPAGNIPAMSVQVDGMTISPTPYITFTSDGMCDFSTVTIGITKSPNSTVFADSIEVGVAQYQGLINLPNFDNGDYHVEVCIFNRYGSPACYERDFTRTLVGIVNHNKPEEFDPSTEIDVVSVLGQRLGKFRYNELNFIGLPRQIVILHYVKKLGEEEYSWKYFIQ
jgi:hypothetical protein